MSGQNQLSDQPKARTFHEGKDTELRTSARSCAPCDTGGIEPANPERPERHDDDPFTPVRLSEYEQAQRYDRFHENLRSGTASPSDLDGCTEIISQLKRQLLRFTDELEQLTAAGIEYRLRHPVDWAARVLHVPPGEPVPSFVLDPLERVFDRAWVQTPRAAPDKAPDIGRFNLCINTLALGTPDAAEFRQRIANGDFDGERRRIRLTERDWFWHSVITRSPEWLPDEAIDESGQRVAKERSDPWWGGIEPFWTYHGQYVTSDQPTPPE